MKRVIAIVALILGIAVLAGGIVSIAIGRSNASDVTSKLKAEKISLAVFDNSAPTSVIISNAAEARQAVNTLIQHRMAIAPTYSDLLQGKHFDPTNPTQLTYAQAMNLQNSMTTAVLAYGLTTTLTFNGVMLIVAGVAIAVLAFAFWWCCARRKEDKVPAAG